MKAPKRIQRSRAKGWRMPENTVYVGRPTQWGNPFRVKGYAYHPTTREYILVKSAGHAVALYEKWLIFSRAGYETMQRVKQELRGKNLACFCLLDQPCHADILLRIANEV